MGEAEKGPLSGSFPALFCGIKSSPWPIIFTMSYWPFFAFERHLVWTSPEQYWVSPVAPDAALYPDAREFTAPLRTLMFWLMIIYIPLFVGVLGGGVLGLA